MRYLHIRKSAVKALIAALSAVTVSVVLAGSPALAGTTSASALLYDYEFTGTTGTVANSAPGGPVTPLTLSGAWTPVADGVHFSGNTTGTASVAYGRPASGYTLNEPASAAVAVGTRIAYKAPPPGTCFADTPNVTQIGRDSALAPSGQVKLQESGCSHSKSKVMMECRVTGSKTAPGAHPVISKLALVNGDAYNVSCVKSPDKSNGTATITLTVTRITGALTVTNKFTVPAIGAVQSTQYISAGNKYPLPSPSQNTDQFNGDMTRAIYCAGTTAAVNSCLSTYLPLN